MTFTKWILATSVAFTAATGMARADSAACEPTDVTLYFADGATDLSEHAEAALEAELERIEHCDVLTIDAYAVSNDASTSTGAVSLSSARAAAALSAVSEAGVLVPVDMISVSYEPVDGVRAPIARKVEMTLVATPRQPNS